MSSKLFALGVVIFIAVAFSMFLFIDSLNGNLSEATGLVVSTESFPTYLETHPVASDLPKNSNVGINIGNNVYEIKGSEVHSTDRLLNKDLIVSLPEGYEEVIGELGICGAIKKAYLENELKVETFSSKAKLFLKYHKLLKYSDCLN